MKSLNRYTLASLFALLSVSSAFAQTKGDKVTYIGQFFTEDAVSEINFSHEITAYDAETTTATIKTSGTYAGQAIDTSQEVEITQTLVNPELVAYVLENCENFQGTKVDVTVGTTTLAGCEIAEQPQEGVFVTTTYAAVPFGRVKLLVKDTTKGISVEYALSTFTLGTPAAAAPAEGSEN